MKKQITGLAVGLLFVGLLGACKKSEPAPTGESASRSPSTESQTAASTAPAAEAGAENGVRLQVKWPVGNRYIYRMDLEQNSTNNIPQMPRPMQQTVTMAMTYAINVLKETENGGRELEMEFLANEMEIKMGEQIMMAFDSKETKDAPQNPIAAPFRKMIGSKVKIQVDSTGKVERVVGLDEWLNSLAADGAARNMLAQQFNEGYFRQIADFGRGLPEKPVEVGDTWPFVMDMPAGPLGKININSTIMFKDLEEREGHKSAVLQAIGTFKGEPGAGAGPMGNMSVEQGKLSGTTWFGAELGALVESVTDQSMRLKGETPGPPGSKAPGPQFTIDLGQKVTMKLVELTKQTN